MCELISNFICDHWRAEEETKLKLDKVAEIKRINGQMMAIKSEISKYEDTLKEYQLYKKFLETLSPKVRKHTTCSTTLFPSPVLAKKEKFLI